MPIAIPPLPRPAERVARETLEALRKDGNVALKEYGSTLLRLQQPHRVFLLGIGDVLERQTINRANCVAWRYLVFKEQSAVADLELTYSENYEVIPEFAGLHVGPLAKMFWETELGAERLSQLQNWTYEPRYLKIPALHVTALWLHNQRLNWVLPIVDRGERVQRGELYSEKDFLAKLYSAAQNVAQHYRRPR